MSNAIPYNDHSNFTTIQMNPSQETDTNQQNNQNKPTVGFHEMIQQSAFENKKKSENDYKMYRKEKFKYEYDCG